MKKHFNFKKITKRLFILVILAYVIYILINQQKTLDSYNTSKEYYEEQLSTQLAYQETLYETKENIDSEEYIEEVAREKLDMYLPNERVYIDSGN